MRDQSRYLAGMFTVFTAPQLAVLSTEYAAATQTSLASLGDRIFNDHRFFKRLVSGLDCTTQSAAKASRWLVENWPGNAPWPDDVPRAAAKSEAA